jgi:hypothetical protein
MDYKSHFENGCIYHSGPADLSVESCIDRATGKRLHYVVCRTCGATGPYEDNIAQSVIRWYNHLDINQKEEDEKEEKTDEQE